MKCWWDSLSFRPRGVPHHHHAPHSGSGPAAKTVSLPPHCSLILRHISRLLSWNKHKLFYPFLSYLVLLPVKCRRATATRFSWTTTTAWSCRQCSSSWNIPSTAQDSSWQRSDLWLSLLNWNAFTFCFSCSSSSAFLYSLMSFPSVPDCPVDGSVAPF